MLFLSGGTLKPAAVSNSLRLPAVSRISQFLTKGVSRTRPTTQKKAHKLGHFWGGNKTSYILQRLVLVLVSLLCMACGFFVVTGVPSNVNGQVELWSMVSNRGQKTAANRLM